jgi:hypothetical protein
MRGISTKRKFNGEIFTLRDPGGYAIRKRDAQQIANFVRGLGEKKVRIVPASPHGYFIYERRK